MTQNHIPTKSLVSASYPDRGGYYHWYKIKPATFNGCHNRVKATVFACLNSYNRLSLRQIVRLTGCNYHSLAHLLKRWRDWQYLDYSYDGRQFVYSLGEKGQRFFYVRVPLNIKIDIQKRLAGIETKLRAEHGRAGKLQLARLDKILARNKSKVK